MPEPKKTDLTPKPKRPDHPHPSVPGTPGVPTPGRAKRGSDFRDQDVYDAPVEDPDDLVAD
jgi:hypothetical protein